MPSWCFCEGNGAHTPSNFELSEFDQVNTQKDLREIASVIPLLASSDDFIPEKKRQQIESLENAYANWEGEEISSSKNRAAVQAAFLYMIKREEMRGCGITTNSLVAPHLPNVEEKRTRVRISLAPDASELPDPRWVFASRSV